MSSSEEKEVDGLAESLEGYKEKVSPENRASLVWEKNLTFHGRTQRGEEIDFDAQVEWGCMPTESLMLSLAGCLAIDVVAFLQKMKSDITMFRLEISGKRNPRPPQYYTRFEIIIHISGNKITPKKMDRVISLSQEKYCSVRHTLRADLDVQISYVIE